MFAAFQVDSLKNDLGAVFLLLVMTSQLVRSRRSDSGEWRKATKLSRKKGERARERPSLFSYTPSLPLITISSYSPLSRRQEQATMIKY